MCAITFCENGQNCQGSCAKSDHRRGGNALTASNGQSCYWFSNGCTVGCDECDGTTNHVSHGFQQFLYKGMNQSEIVERGIILGTDVFDPKPGDMVLDQSTTKGLVA